MYRLSMGNVQTCIPEGPEIAGTTNFAIWGRSGWLVGQATAKTFFTQPMWRCDRSGRVTPKDKLPPNTRARAGCYYRLQATIREVDLVDPYYVPTLSTWSLSFTLISVVCFEFGRVRSGRMSVRWVSTSLIRWLCFSTGELSAGKLAVRSLLEEEGGQCVDERLRLRDCKKWD